MTSAQFSSVKYQTLPDAHLHRVPFVSSLNFHVNFPLKFELYETAATGVAS